MWLIGWFVGIFVSMLIQLFVLNPLFFHNLDAKYWVLLFLFDLAMNILFALIFATVFKKLFGD